MKFIVQAQISFGYTLKPDFYPLSGRYFKGYCCIFNRMESQTIARKIEKDLEDRLSCHQVV